ncbi:MAG: hypothetical protein ABIN97_16850 [Ginsengibacter sp.]
MKKILFLILILSNYSSFAHPGIGIVMDSRGNIFYTDLENVWKITAAGKKSIAVHNVHTHELSINANDDLYGENLWYNGEKSNTWGHYVWCLHRNNKLDTISGPSEGFLKNYSFVRDKNENMYWAERDTLTRFKKKSTNGSITIITEGKFTDIRWMYATNKGVIYFIDLVDLYKIDTSGNLIIMAKNISENSAAFKIYSGKHSLLGIWTDSVENIYVANLSGQVVKRISQAGKVENFVYSTTPWSPTGGLFDKEGNLWLLETSLTNGTRIRKIVSSEFMRENTTPSISNNILPPAGVAGIILAITLIIRFLFIRKRKTLSGSV